MSDNLVPSSDLMEALMKDPVKRALLLQLLHQEKDGFEAYKQRELKDVKKQTPVKKVKTLHCESPTALHRRRALEKLNPDTTSESSSSELSEVSAELKGPKLPFEKLLQGIKAYVEVKRNNADRSEGIKAVMKLMGATVEDEFTRDVTHVIFKDGSFTTYQKAKLMKVHLVSVLWLEAVRKNSARVPEKNYPAFGSQVCDDENVSILCSQLQKDYEDIIKDEKRRTVLASQKPVNRESKNRRRTTTAQPSRSSYLTSCKSSQSLFSDIDQDVDSTSDDSDCGVIDGQSSKRSKNRCNVLDVSPSITDDLSNTSKSKVSSQNSDLLKSSSSMSSLNRVNTKNNRKTINIISDMVLTPTVNPVSIGDSRNKLNTGTTMSSLRVSSENDRTKSDLASLSLNEQTRSSDDRTKSGLDGNISTANNNVSDSGKDNKENWSNATVQTTMSSLRLSDSCSKNSAPSKSKKNNVTKNRSRSSSAPKNNNRRSSVLKDTVSGANVSKEKINSTSSIKNKYNKNTEKNKSSSSSDSDDEFVSKENKSKGGLQNLHQRVTRRSVLVQKLKPEVEKEELDKRRKSIQNDLKSRRSRSLSKTNYESRLTSKETLTKPKVTNKRLSKAEINEAEEDDQNPNPEITMQCKVLLETVVSPTKRPRIESSSQKRTKKLYNPDENIIVSSPLEYNKEREEYLKKKTKKSPDEIFMNPNKMHISSLKCNASKKTTLTGSEQSSDDNGEKESRIKKSTPKSAGRDSVVDEQKELLELLTNKENSQMQRSTRRSQRISLSQNKPKYRFTSSFSDTRSTDSLPITPIKRRSTLDFQSLTQSQQKRKLKFKKRPSIVCTKMHREEVRNFERVVKNLGTFFVENQVSDKTTHLVAGESKRTINMLRALARGCWILRHDWVLKSQEVGKWLPEEDYEVTEFSPAVQQCRLQRQAFGPKYRMDIFKDCGFIYVAKSTTPKQTDLQELIITCQGRVTTFCRNAAIAIGELIRNEDVTCVTEAWILDSITFNKLKPFKNYRIKPQRQESDGDSDYY